MNRNDMDRRDTLRSILTHDSLDEEDEKDKDFESFLEGEMEEAPEAAVNSEEEWDTDLEDNGDIRTVSIDDDEKSRSIYLAACRKFKVVPSNAFLKGLQKGSVRVNYQGLGPLGTKAVALGLVINRRVKELQIAGNSIGHDGIKFICDMMMENEFITSLDLSENELDSFAAEHIAEMVHENDTLASLKLSDNSFKGKDAFLLAEIFTNPHRTGLKELDLGHNQLDDEGGKIIGHALGQNDFLWKVNLSWNQIRIDGIRCIAKGLQDNTFLRILDLSRNGLGEKGADAIASALRVNRTLQELNLSQNRVTTHGMVLLFKAIAGNSCLRKLILTLNPITFEGLLFAMDVLRTSSVCALRDLEMADICVPRAFFCLMEEVLSIKPYFRFKHGGYMDFKDVYQEALKQSRTAWMKDPVLVFIHFVQERKMKMLDLFKAFDKDRNCSITREEFKSGLQNIGLPLSDTQLDDLINTLDIDSSGEIDLDEFLEGHNKHLKRLRKYLTRSDSRPASRVSSATSSRPSSRGTASRPGSKTKQQDKGRSNTPAGKIKDGEVDLLQLPGKMHSTVEPTVVKEDLDSGVIIPLPKSITR